MTVSRNASTSRSPARPVAGVLSSRPPSCREWLRSNSYVQVADLIDEVMEEWRATGKRTRRDWWIILAGNRKGFGRVVSGRIFPVLREASERALPNVAHPNSSVPPVRVSNRWPLRDA